ncbi:MAG: hypothetical protein E6J74_42295 [Deltaproteobacteria bacterium]|nr:MAG: hypothetical protein E6J74_42295 [Deltaproteobacteria bacterium]
MEIVIRLQRLSDRGLKLLRCATSKTRLPFVTEITIGPGESVTWTNDDGAPHGLAYHDGAKGTDLLLPRATFSRRFDRPGTYDYNCAVHPYMTGRVVVQAK